MQRHSLSSAPVGTARFSPESRAGVTLTEVLISLLVMSVAVTSVATLFPLSLLRSVKGRQLTQATILRYNAENQLDLHPGLANDLPSNEPAILDPLGWHLIKEVYPGLEKSFGNDGQNPPNALPVSLQRTHGNTFSNLEAARKLVSLPDTWVDTARGIPTNYYLDGNNVPNLVLPPEVDFSAIPFDPDPMENPNVPYPLGIARVTVFDATARFSDVRTIIEFFTDGACNKVLKLSSELSPRVLGNIGEARIEIQEQRYTWLLTVRSSVRSADVVVFFRRSFSAEDERIHTAIFSLTSPGPDGQPGDAGIDDNSNGVTDEPAELGWDGTDDGFDPFNRTIPIRWAQDPPTLKRGGYIFDVQNALWYRIHDIPSLNKSNKTAILVLDEVIKAKGTGGAILMRGIVDVYPISF